MKYIVKTGDGNWLALQGPENTITVYDAAHATRFDSKEEAEKQLAQRNIDDAQIVEYKS